MFLLASLWPRRATLATPGHPWPPPVRAMTQVRPDSMYDREEEGSLVNSLLTLVSLLVVLLTLPLSIWQCVKVMALPTLVP